MSDTHRLKLDQRGMVSFMVTLIMMMVITLIVIGFSQVTRRNERESLDRQLSAQAFYAAESGINAARDAITNYTGGYENLPSKKTCSNDYDANNPAGGVGGSITDMSSGIRYTCVLVDSKPKDIVRSISQSASSVVTIKADGALKSLKFAWPKSGAGSCSGGSETYFPPFASWSCGNAVVRVDLLEDVGGTVDSSALDARTKSIFLTPYGGNTGDVTVTGPEKVFVGSAINCATLCEVEVTLSGTSANYLARIVSIYREAPNLTISGTLTATNAAAKFLGSQAIVDVTGQAQDQIRRIQARVGLGKQSNAVGVPASALSSGGSICKQFSIAPSASFNFSGICP